MDISPELKGTSIFLVGKNHLMLSDASELNRSHVDYGYVLVCLV